MSAVRMEWTARSKSQFEGALRVAVDVGRRESFSRTHNEIVLPLRDLDQALTKGELLFRTRKEGGQVRHWMVRAISVVYAIFPMERLGWIIKYDFMPNAQQL